MYHVSWYNWRYTTHFVSEDDYRTGCRNVSHCQQQQSYSGVRLPGRSNSTYFYCNLLISWTRHSEESGYKRPNCSLKLKSSFMREERIIQGESHNTITCSAPNDKKNGVWRVKTSKKKWMMKCHLKENLKRQLQRATRIWEAKQVVGLGIREILTEPLQKNPDVDYVNASPLGQKI